MPRTTGYAGRGPETPGGRVERLLREVWGGSQRRMAAEIGVSQALISKVVRGEQAPGRKLLEALARHPRVDATWVYQGVGEPLAGPDRGEATGEPMLPVARCVLPGPPQGEAALLTGALFPVAASFHRPSRYWLEAQPYDAVVLTPEHRIAAGDLLLMEADAGVWGRNPQVLVGRLCAIREGGDAASFVLDRLGWDPARRRLVRETTAPKGVPPEAIPGSMGRAGRFIELERPETTGVQVQEGPDEAAPSPSAEHLDIADVVAFVVLLVRS